MYGNVHCTLNLVTVLKTFNPRDTHGGGDRKWTLKANLTAFIRCAE